MRAAWYIRKEVNSFSPWKIFSPWLALIILNLLGSFIKACFTFQKITCHPYR
jgi:hypothetical protein